MSVDVGVVPQGKREVLGDSSRRRASSRIGSALSPEPRPAGTRSVQRVLASQFWRSPAVRLREADVVSLPPAATVDP